MCLQLLSSGKPTSAGDRLQSSTVNFFTRSSFSGEESSKGEGKGTSWQQGGDLKGHY